MHTNGKLKANTFLGRVKSRGYRVPYVFGMGAFGIDDRPRYTWLDAERMRRDPQVIFGLGILRAPLYGATWEIKSDRTKVSEFVDSMLKRFWMRCLRKTFHFLEHGVACGELGYKLERGVIVLDELLDFHPRDVRPLEYLDGKNRGSLAGIRLRACVGSDENTTGTTDFLPPHAWWFPGESEFGSLYSRPRLAGAYEPWLEKRGRNGATDSRRMWFKRCAFRGGMMRYPDGSTDYGDESGSLLKNNQDIARELVEKFENGGVLALPNTKDLQTGAYLWEFEPPAAHSDVTGLRDYPKDLDREILIGMGIPPELVEAATVGSGYSGRAIPAQMFFSSMDEIAVLLLGTIDRQIIRPLVEVNFGKVSYQIVPGSLAKMALTQGQPPTVAGGGGGSTPDSGAQATQQPQQPQPIQLSAAQSDAIQQLANTQYPYPESVYNTSATNADDKIVDDDEVDDEEALQVVAEIRGFIETANQLLEGAK